MVEIGLTYARGLGRVSRANGSGGAEAGNELDQVHLDAHGSVLQGAVSKLGFPSNPAWVLHRYSSIFMQFTTHYLDNRSNQDQAR